jgi:hypothetical protein
MLGIWHPTGKKLLNMFDHALSVRKEFEKCEISLVEPSQVSYVVQLARESIDAQIAKALAVDAFKEKRETCTICLEDIDVTKIHVIEGCAHCFCFSCMKEHVKAKLFHGMLPACPQEGCTTKLTVEGSDISFGTSVGDHGAACQGRTDPPESEDILSLSQVFSLDVLERGDSSNARFQLEVHGC